MSAPESPPFALLVLSAIIAGAILIAIIFYLQ
jgi:hypothetical protein